MGEASGKVKSRVVPFALVAGTALLAYWPAFGSYFLSDDFVLLTRSRDPWVELASLDERFFRPVTLWFWKLTVLGLADAAPAHHLVNLLLHGLNTLLLYRLAGRLWRRRETAFVAAAVFCLFPTHPEAVTWLAGRFDLLCATFYLASLLALLKHLEEGRGGWLGLSTILGGLAMLSKEMALSLPLVAAFVTIHFDDARPGRVVRAVWPLAALPFGILALHLVAADSSIGYPEQFRPGWSTLRLVWSPLELFFFPWNAALLDSGLRLAGWLFSLVTLVHLAALLQFRRTPGAAIWLLAVLYVTALPLVNLDRVYSNLQDSRYYYLPAAVFALWLTNFLVTVPRRRIVIPAYLALLAATLYVHNLPWRMAGAQSRRIVQQLESLGPGPRRLDGIPDHVLGAYVFRNGLDVVGRSFPGVQGETCWRTRASSRWHGRCEAAARPYVWTGERFEPAAADR